MRTPVRDNCVANGVKELTIETVNSGCGITKHSTDNKNKSTKSTVKVLGASNQIAPLNFKTMGASKENPKIRTSMSRRSQTSKRMTLSAKNVSTTTSTNRKTMDPKSNQTSSSTTLFAKPKSTDKFHCKSCDMSFFYKTSLAAHEKNHAISNTCKYCNRNFAIESALSKHLRENCSKISVAERKKLLAIDDKSPQLNRTMQRTPTRTPKTTQSTDKLLDLVYKSCSPSEVDRLKTVQFKNVPSMRGFRHTPRKLIKCYQCGDKFKDPFLYATHAEHCVPPKSDDGNNL